MGNAFRLNAAVAVELVVLTLGARSAPNDTLCALLVQRLLAPYRGRWALPGGFVQNEESLSAAAVRELREETGIRADRLHLEQLATYGEPGRDPRGRVISTAYLALVPNLPAPNAGGDAVAAAIWSVDQVLADRGRLAFDHRRILADGVERARAKLEYTPLATAFCGREFTVADLRRVYEVMWGTTIDPRNFHRKVTTTPGFVEPTGRTTTRDGGRPARLYRAGPAQSLRPPMLRPN
ncbi:NUDIX hydrolase [Nocardia terpenica]|uniref:NUDIX hydrolase n=1 Tax=Nocardia terpenica TaxID=455432 RepID=A0A164KA09_9NOCA|nr:NUDIX domain-containing protein [Nocardia terpenica]KZM71194.1 NUDIX hydrolase [Nocardia terpenica]MBF6060258.1 NUDIX hydrolase [Nocardia terpenica]MBF6103518.1 NUDIX hydrolase [Nocardia terpenica]MBF6112108.1 NUDIX hydrolase [Nocardia terpenica]MBF6117739.1 NUDIX hydrolase [Nocardia terpenica]